MMMRPSVQLAAFTFDKHFRTAGFEIL